MKVSLGTRKIMCSGVLFFTATLKMKEAIYLSRLHYWQPRNVWAANLYLRRFWSCWANPCQCYGRKGLRFDRTYGSLSGLPPPANDNEADLNCSGGWGREIFLEPQWAHLGANRSSRIYSEIGIAQHLLLSDNNKTTPSYTL